jgi:hypothetical protein
MAVARKRKKPASNNGVPPVPRVVFPEGVEDAFNTVSAEDVIEHEVDWLSPGRLSMGSVWIIDGNKGSGKSSIAAAVAAAITGGPALPGGPAREWGSVLWCAGEECLSQVKRKLAAAGAFPESVLFPGRNCDGLVERTVAVSEHEAKLEATVKRHGARLLVLDTLACFAGGADLNQEIPARSVMSPLTRIAQACGLLVLGIRHPRKTPVANPLDRGMGSPAIAAAARGVLTTGREGDYGRRCLGVLVNNDGPAAATLCYDLVDCDGVPRVEWREEIALEADRIEFGPVEESQTLPRLEAKQLLRRRIGDDWVSAAEVLAEARRNGISQDQLDRARWKLGVRSRRVGKLGAEGHWQYGPPNTGWPADL